MALKYVNRRAASFSLGKPCFSATLILKANGVESVRKASFSAVVSSTHTATASQRQGVKANQNHKRTGS